MRLRVRLTFGQMDTPKMRLRVRLTFGQMDPQDETYGQVDIWSDGPP